MKIDFKTKLNLSVDYSSKKPKGFDYDSRSSSCNLKYSLNLNIAQWGIANSWFSVDKQGIEFNLDLIEGESEFSKSFLFVFKLESIDVDTTSNSLLLNSNNDICPKEIIINIKEIKQLNNYEFEAKGSGILVF